MVSIPDTCDKVSCDEGMICEVRKRNRDGAEIARCVADKIDPENPRSGSSCAEVKCEEDEVCMMIEERARCSKPSPPEDCNQLECPQGMECLPTQNERRVRCVVRKGMFWGYFNRKLYMYRGLQCVNTSCIFLW